jgi:hypothetical protein
MKHIIQHRDSGKLVTRGKYMKVHELIKALTSLPQNMEVVIRENDLISKTLEKLEQRRKFRMDGDSIEVIELIPYKK